jgi:hypothetical protein
MRSLGYDVLAPSLSNWFFSRAVAQAQRAYDQFNPAVIVGSSRGGAAAMNMDGGGTPLILVAPAWKRWGRVRSVCKANSIILHSPRDDVVPFDDSIELCLNSGGLLSIIPAGQDHRMNDEQARMALERALLLVVGKP